MSVELSVAARSDNLSNLLAELISPLVFALLRAPFVSFVFFVVRSRDFVVRSRIYTAARDTTLNTRQHKSSVGTAMPYFFANDSV